MLIMANVTHEWRPLLWREAFKTPSLLDGLTVINIGGVSQMQYEHWGLSGNGKSQSFNNAKNI
jgi:hypothetical protein